MVKLNSSDISRRHALRWIGGVIAGATLTSILNTYGCTRLTMEDAYHRRILSGVTDGGIRVFTNWLDQEGVGGYIGEVGWPNDLQRGFGDSPLYNALAEQWWQVADRANLYVTAFSADERQVYGGYSLNIYTSIGDGVTRTISKPQSQAVIFEAHPTTKNYKRGINVSCGEQSSDSSSTFTNRDVGTYDADYWYASRSTYNYLYSRGVHIIRMPFRWERLQRTLKGNLDVTELQRIKDSVAEAGLAGLQVILDCHNYGSYFMDVDGVRTELKIGSASLTQGDFVDLWTKLSTEFKDDPTVLAYDLMNEPHAIPAQSANAAARSWEACTQHVLNAIRENDDAKLIMIPGYDWSAAERWDSSHPHKWITDPENNHLYTAHHYWGFVGGSNYEASYAAELARCQSSGW